MTKTALDSWAKESLAILKKYGYIHSSYKLVWILIVVVLGLSFLLLGYYGGSQGWLKSENNQTVNLEPETTLNNTYFFTPFVDNEYIFKIINNITISDTLCD